MVELDEFLIDEIKKSVDVVKVYIDSELYYIKKDADFKEIVGYELAKSFGLKALEYKTLNIDGINYAISKDMNEAGNFILFKDLDWFADSADLYNIWQILELNNLLNISELMQSIIKMYLYDLLFMNSDRNFTNFGLLITDFWGKLIIFDHGCMFDNEISINLSADLDETYVNDNYEDFKIFLKTTSSEFVTDFLEVLKKITPQNFNALLCKIENSYQICLKKRKIWEYLYRTNYNNLKAILEEYRGDYFAR